MPLQKAQGPSAIVPMLIFALLVYNVFAFLGPMFFDVSGLETRAERVDFVLDKSVAIGLISGDVFRFSIKTGIIMFGLGMLFIEIVRATNSTDTSIANHILSVLVLVFAVVEFVVLDGFGTSTFFLLVLMCLLDVTAGLAVSISAARRDFGMG